MSGTVLQSGAGIKAISLCTIFTKTFPSWTLSEKLMNFVVCLSLVPPMVDDEADERKVVDEFVFAYLEAI